MSAISDSGHVVTDSDDIFSDDSSTTKVASDTKDAQLDNIKAVLAETRDAPDAIDEEVLYQPDYDGQVFWWLIAFRLLNSSIIRTIFQPDEYFQALEPAWDIAFGSDSGAWITWEWKHSMRSTIPPFMFAGLYWLCAKVAEYLQLSPAWKAELLIAAPKTLQACIAAIGDYYIWKLGELAYGCGELGHWFALVLTIANPFHFFVVTRTLANSTELSLNAAALYLWFTSAPEEPTNDPGEEQEETVTEDENLSSSWISTKLEESTTKVKEFVTRQVRAYDLNRLRLCLILAAVGCILRITNALTWLALVSFEFIEYETKWHYLTTVLNQRISFPQVTPRLRQLNHAHLVLVREAVLSGSAVLVLSMILDKQYYGKWTLPAVQFLYVNVAEGVSTFYGTHDILWYFSQGFPLLLGAFVVFAFMQVRHYLFTAPQTEEDFPSIIKYEFSAIALFVPIIFSFIAHKEARFIYPLIPVLHVLAAGPAAEFFRPLFSFRTPSSLLANLQDRKVALRLGIATLILFVNLLVTIIISIFHQRAPLDVMDYLRHEHEAHYLPQPPAATGLATADTSMTVGFLMPCHSTPWRSHFVHPSIKAWALGCEPPLGLSAAEKFTYRDEADQFYDAPEAFLRRALGQPKRAKSKKTGWSWGSNNSGLGGALNEGLGTHGLEDQVAWDGKPGRKMWPEYLVFFAEKEELLGKILEGTNYVQCWRGWNTWFHDDWRRKGDMVVWCLGDKPLDLRMDEGEGVMARKLTRKIKGWDRD